MSPQTGELFLREVAPRIRSSMHSFVPVGSDDREEQCQDAMATAAQLLHSVEARAKAGVSAGNIAYFAVKLVKQGRRSYGSRPDPLHPVASVSGRCSLVSLEQPLNGTCDGDEPCCLHDLLAGKTEDPSKAACRRLDWAGLLALLDRPTREVLICLAEGQDLTTLVPKLKRARSTLQTDKAHLADLVKEHLGDGILREVQQQPRWRDNIEATRERLACRYERQPA